MVYNWEKIFKNKSDKELYEIFLGKRLLNDEAKEYAEKELKQRKFDFSNIEAYKKKWKLEKLIQEERNEIGVIHFGWLYYRYNSKETLWLAIISAFIVFFLTLDYFFIFFKTTYVTNNQYVQLVLIIVLLLQSVFALLLYFRKRKEERLRKEEIKKLIN
ncbi:MAG: hypothetical protein GX587_08830, partial [Bacteroidales bacterium]|nr:hypothetical protein [Bacteroidales bacterium]